MEASHANAGVPINIFFKDLNVYCVDGKNNKILFVSISVLGSVLDLSSSGLGSVLA